MTELQFWQQRLLQTLHDPIHKAALLGSGRAHMKEAAALFQELTGLPLKFVARAPDWFAAGADRPLLGNSALCKVDWRQAPLATHPLQPGASVRVPNGDQLLGRGAQARAEAAGDTLADWWEEQLAESAAEEASEAPTGSVWTDAARLRALCLAVWRGLPASASALGLSPELVPADSRCPDHSLPSHTRVAAAACFLPSGRSKVVDPSRTPCLVQVKLHDVQEFISESRKTRDLWTASMIYGELIWAAMAVLVRHYGPECVLYPDLRGNVFMDHYLLHEERGLAASTVPDEVRDDDARTRAVPLPHTFTALLPRGGEGHLRPIASLLGDCERAVANRWTELCIAVERHLSQTAVALEGPWARAKADPPTLSWTAVEWPNYLADQPIPEAPGEFLPGRGATRAAPPPAPPPPALPSRQAALEPWVKPATWTQMEVLRRVAGYTCALMDSNWLKRERGFDYPLVHAQLLNLHKATTAARPLRPRSEPGAKCSVTGRHEALRADLGHRAAHRYWKMIHGEDGAERLGAPAALKRFLAAADDPAFTRRTQVGRRTDEAPRAPFPSTATLAAGPFLEGVARNASALETELRAFVQALKACASLPDKTTHPRALPRLQKYAQGDSALAEFLGAEAQYLSLPVLETHKTAQKADPKETVAIDRLIATVKALHQAVRALNARGAKPPIPAMETDIAVLYLDGDGVSGVLGGDGLCAQWRDILHPKAAEILRGGAMESTYWVGQLSEPRVITPSLHATLTRALATLTDSIAPWVVEVEFSGRLIYAGGDDILAMVPASQALPVACRLQQLASAPWVVDTNPDTSSWEATHDPARPRFCVPRLPDNGPLDLSTCDWEDAITAEGTAQAQPHSLDPRRSRVIPLLGRSHGLSAGIAFGHFKTPLDELLRVARANLDERAKTCSRRSRERRPGQALLPPQGHLAISRFTGSGAKSTLVAPWSLGAAPTPKGARVDPRPPTLWSTLHAISAVLEGRAPYKVRAILGEMEGLLIQADEEELTRLTQGALRVAQVQHGDANPLSTALQQTALLCRSLHPQFRSGELADGQQDEDRHDCDAVLHPQFRSGELADDICALLLLARHLRAEADDV